MTFEWFVARRYLVARRRQAFISLISLVSVLGVGVGVMALIVALALMTGVQSELRDRILGSTAHLMVYKTGGPIGDTDAEVARLRDAAGATGAAPAILGYGLMQSSKDTSEKISIKGIDPAREPGVTEIRTAMRNGSIEALATRPDGALPGVVLGADLARTLGVTVNDTVTVFTTALTMSPLGPMPKLRSLTVVGTFELGFYEFDSSYAFVSLPTAEQMLNGTGPDFIQLRLAHIEDAPGVRDRLQDTLGPGYLVRDWTELNKALYSALSLEKFAISLTIGLIVMVAALNIVASLVLLVMEKSPDIAILRTMGASAPAIRRIFMFQGLAIGMIGTLSGTVLGLIVSYVADRYRLIPLNPDVYQITYLPFHVLPIDVGIVVVSAVAVCYLATLYPSRQAGRLDPAEALRNL